MTHLDIFVNSYIAQVRGPFLTETMYLLSAFFDVSVLSVLLTALVTILIKIICGKKYAGLFLISICASATLSYVLKIFFNVARPTGGVMLAFGPSFPSYHATVSAVFFIMIIFIFDDFLPHIWRILLNIFCIFCIFLVAFSRIYLGVHWLSDVSAGILLGAVISLVAIWIFRKVK
jgi:undecaprenyl-diphosphatase